MDRVIVSRLIESPPEQYPQAPFHYLLGCYARSSQELRSISVALPDDVRQKLQESIFAARDLIISYTGLVFMGGLVPEVGFKAHAGAHAGSHSDMCQIYTEAAAGLALSTAAIIDLPRARLDAT